MVSLPTDPDALTGIPVAGDADVDLAALLRDMDEILATDLNDIFDGGDHASGASPVPTGHGGTARCLQQHVCRAHRARGARHGEEPSPTSAAHFPMAPTAPTTAPEPNCELGVSTTTVHPEPTGPGYLSCWLPTSAAASLTTQPSSAAPEGGNIDRAEPPASPWATCARVLAPAVA